VGEDHVFLERTLALAKKREGFCAPNPSVGAVVVKAGQVIAEGWHEGPGTVHAEVMALSVLAEGEAKGATVYVSLEPCCHHGRTPPCTEMLMAKEVSRVVYGKQDPNPLVAGKGQETLLNEGIDCQQVSLDAISQFYRPYSFWQKHQRPWLIAKLAMSLDGKSAGEKGEPIQITGKGMQHFTHERRFSSDALLTTANTIIADDPQFNVRLGEQVFQKPLWVLDSQARISPAAKIFETAKPVVIVHGPAADKERLAALKARGAVLREIPLLESKVNLGKLWNLMGAAGLHKIWIESGGQLLQTLLEGQYLHEFYLALGPKILGENALSAFPKALDLEALGMKPVWRALRGDSLGFFDFTLQNND
jgi:diaminohydroxyphosphoribosylaminopyrimidine deaminase/5-amino-6-(5-phosphoribosylamino)uracil reductase